MANIQDGNSVAGLMNVNSDFEGLVALTKNILKAGYVAAIAENDPGTLFGSKRVKSLQSSEDGKLQIGLTTPLFNYNFNALAQDSGQWRYITSTMTTSWTGTGMLLNTALSTASGAGTMISTWRQFPSTLQGGQRFDFEFNQTAVLLANQELILGWIPFASGTAVPTEGVYVKYSSAGMFGFTNFNASEANVTGQLATAASFLNDTTYLISIIVYDRVALFLRDGVLMANGVLNIPSAVGQNAATGCFPLSVQFRNTGILSGTPIAQIKITDVAVSQLDLNLGIQYPTLQALSGLMGSQGTNGNTQGSTALLANNQAAGAGVALNNTTAAAGVGLGGQFSVLPTLAVGTDGILDSYPIPVGGINVTPRSLLIYGVRIQGVVTTVLSATAVTYLYSLAYGHTTVSAATAEGLAAKATRRIPLGFETYASAAAVGTLGSAGIFVPFTAPIIVNPGEFVAILAKNLNTVTTSGVITFSITFDSQWI